LHQQASGGIKSQVNYASLLVSHGCKKLKGGQRRLNLQVQYL
jgi:hypothetical protein